MDENYKNQNNDGDQPFDNEDNRNGQQYPDDSDKINLTPDPEEKMPESSSPAEEPQKAAEKHKAETMHSKKEKKKTAPEKEPKKKKGFWARLWSAMKFIYMVITVPYFIMVVLLITAFLVGVFKQDELIDMEKGSRFARGGFNETTLIEGSRDKRIALIDVQDIITFETSEKFRSRIKKVGKDKSVAAVIVRVTSPGGVASASDLIHHYIESYKEETGIPVYGYMSGVAASGGYYLSVACDEIYAEPTTITGSIGVILQSFNLETLMNEKLGINNITVKSGEKKDWPKMFDEVTQEQLDYIKDKMITPAYQRFVSLVADGRDKLSKQQVLQLADGSIYYSDEAVENGLIDGISYLEELRKKIAEDKGLENPEVFGYSETFNLDFLLRNAGADMGFFPKAEQTLQKIKSPKLMYLWKLDN